METESKETARIMRIQSKAFRDGDRIPDRHVRDGDDLSPPLVIEDLPEEATSVALIVDDPDAPGKTWVHWLIWGIPADAPELREGVPTGGVLESMGGARQGRNDYGGVGYGGPQPPRGHGVHHYRFTAYALREHVDLDAGAGREALEAEMEGRTVATARLTGTFERT